MKTYRGIITNWQIHNLTFSDIQKKCIDDMYPQIKERNITKFQIITGTITGDPTCNRQDGDHFRSSFVLTIDRENGKLETLNTVYDLGGGEGNDYVCNLTTGSRDMGNDVIKLFY